MTAENTTIVAPLVPEDERNFMNDQVFKFVFGKEARKDITMDFLNALLQDELESPIRDLQFLPQECSADASDDKEPRLDVVCRLDNGSQVDIEVQLSEQCDMAQRSLYYWATKYRSGLRKGGTYDELTPMIAVNILGFRYFQGDEPLSSWGIYNKKTGERLTNHLSLNFLEIPKFSAMEKPRSKWTRIERWMCYFSDKISVAKKKELLMQDAVISRAIEATEQFFQDPVQRQIYLERERARLDRLSNEKYSYQKGREEGREKECEANILNALSELSLAQVVRIFKKTPEYVRSVAQKHGMVLTE